MANTLVIGNFTKNDWDTHTAERSYFTFKTLDEAKACAARRIAIGMTGVEIAKVIVDNDTRFCTAFALKAG